MESERLVRVPSWSLNGSLLVGDLLCWRESLNKLGVHGGIELLLEKEGDRNCSIDEENREGKELRRRN